MAQRPGDVVAQQRQNKLRLQPAGRGYDIKYLMLFCSSSSLTNFASDRLELAAVVEATKKLIMCVKWLQAAFCRPNCVGRFRRISVLR